MAVGLFLPSFAAAKLFSSKSDRQPADSGPPVPRNRHPTSKETPVRDAASLLLPFGRRLADRPEWTNARCGAVTVYKLEAMAFVEATRAEIVSSTLVVAFLDVPVVTNEPIFECARLPLSQTIVGILRQRRQEVT